MRVHLVFFVMAIALLGSCKGGSKAGDSVANDVQEDSLAAAENEGMDIPKGADELFDDFVFNFAANKKYQLERIHFPLLSIDGKQEKRLKRSEWKIENFFMDQGYYTLLFDNERDMQVVNDTTLNHAVVEKIYFEKQQVTQYVFNRIKGLWMLTTVKTIPISENVNASFLTFYHRFATDQEFQNNSLASSVQFIGPDPDDDFNQMEGIISPDTWEAFAPELPGKMIYNILYGEPRYGSDSKLFVIRGIANGQEQELTFRRTNGVWKLVKLTT